MKMRDLDIVRRTSLLMAASACLAVWPQPAAAQSRAQEAAVLQYSPADVRAAVTRLRTVVQDRFTTETDLESARAELQALVVRADELAAKALEVMESWMITSLVIVDGDGRPAGIIHMHDILRAKIV